MKPSLSLGLISLVGTTALGYASGAAAQGIPLERSTVPTRPAVPEAEAPQPRALSAVQLPEVPEGPAAASTSGEPAVFHIDNVVLLGNGILTENDIAPFVAGWKGREVSYADLANLQDGLTREIVIKKHYITSGARVDITNNVLTINVVSGRLVDTHLVGASANNSYLSKTYLNSRLSVSLTQPLKADDLQSAFQLFLEDRHVKSLNARLVPGSRPGESILELDLQEQPRQEWSAFVRTDRSPSVGGTRAGVDGHYAGGRGDDVWVQAAHAQGLNEGSLTYSLPLSARGLMLTASVQGSQAKILDKPLNALDAQSGSLYESLGVTIPFIQKPGKFFGFTASVDHLRVHTDLLGSPFTFSPGAVNGITDYSTVRNSLQYSYFSNRRAVVLNASFNYGLTGQRLATDVDRHFGVWDLSGQYTLAIAPSKTIILRGQARVSDSRLYPTEMLSIGGEDTVRGYRQNAILGNKGYWGSLEYQMPMQALWKSVFRKPLTDRWAQARVGFFVDAGKIDGATVGKDSKLASIGVRWQCQPLANHPNLSVDVHAAKALVKPNYHGDLQDAGIGINLRYKFSGAGK